MRRRFPLAVLALLLIGVLAVMAPLAEATGGSDATTAKKALKCKKGYTKKSITKTVKKKNKRGKTVKVKVKLKKCVKNKRAAKKPAPTPVRRDTTFSGTTSQGLPITINKRLSGSISVVAKVRVNCGPNDDRSYDVSAIGVANGSNFTLNDTNAKSPGNASRVVQVRGTIGNGAATGTIQPKSTSQCAGDPPVSFRAKAK